MFLVQDVASIPEQNVEDQRGRKLQSLPRFTSNDLVLVVFVAEALAVEEEDVSFGVGGSLPFL